MITLRKNETGFSTVEIVMAIVIVALIGVVGFMVYDNHNKTTKDPVATTTTDKKSDTDTKTKKSAEPTAEMKSKATTAINVLISKGYYKDLAANMAPSVTVLKQSTDYDGQGLTASEAANVVASYLTKSSTSEGAALPWDFTTESEARTKISQSTTYKTYTPQGSIGISGNNWVVSYQLDSNLKIDTFYMSVSTDLIQ